MCLQGTIRCFLRRATLYWRPLQLVNSMFYNNLCRKSCGGALKKLQDAARARNKAQEQRKKKKESRIAGRQRKRKEIRSTEHGRGMTNEARKRARIRKEERERKEREKRDAPTIDGNPAGA